MKRGIDTNVLVYAHMAACPDHGPVREYLSGQLARKDVTLVVTPSVLHELVHVMTDPKRLADTILAATLLCDGVRQLVTCNPGDFELFPALQIVDPRLAPGS